MNSNTKKIIISLIAGLIIGFSPLRNSKLAQFLIEITGG